MPVNPEDMIQLLMKTNADQEERLKEKDQTISDLRATVEELRNTVTDLRSTIANLNETLDEFKRKFFGKKTIKKYFINCNMYSSIYSFKCNKYIF